MGSKKLILLALFLISRVADAWAVTIAEQYNFSLIDINGGLSHDQVKCFLKDSRGYLWIGTAAGLNRYDGYKLKVFKYNSNDSCSVIGNNITKLFEGPEGKIWVQTTMGTSVYNPKTEKFYNKPENFVKQYNLPAGAAVEDIVKDKKGNFWFISTGQGITKYNPANNSSVTLTHSTSGKGSISSNHVSAIGQSSSGDLWVVHQNGVFEKLDVKTLKVVERCDKIYKKAYQKLFSYSLTVDSDDDLWIHSSDNPVGVFYYKEATQSLSHFHKNSAQLQLNNNLARGIVESEKGTIWIGTDHGGINVINKKGLTVHYINHNSEVDRSLAHNSINTLYKDSEGIIWIGTFKKGVNYYHKNIIRFPHFKYRTSIKESLPFDDVNTFVEDEKGNLWIGTNGGGLVYMDRATGTFSSYRHDAGDDNSISSDVIVTLLLDKNKQLWIGTYLGGLDKFDGKKFTHYKNDPKNPHSLSDDSVWELFEDSKGNLWVGTLHGGLELFDPLKDRFRHSKVNGGEFPVHCNYLSSIAEDRHGNMWIGGGYGLDVLNKETGKSTFFSHEPENPKSLISNNITSIHRDKNNNIWIGTTEGLDLYDEKKNVFHHFTVNDGLPSNTIVSILEDDKSNLWLSTSNGLSNLILKNKEESIDKLSVGFRNYDELDGLQGKAFNENAAYRTSRGELIFGGSNGFNLFYPGSLSKNKTAPKVVLSDLQLFNKSVEVGEDANGRAILSKSLYETKSITLKHDENAFSIEFAALNFFHPEKNNYKYKLEGFDKKWHAATDGIRKATYTNLDPGEYVFRVIASNNDDVWNEEGVSLKITVLAPFWRTNMAYALYVLFALAILVVIRKVELQKARMNFLLEQERRESRHMHELDLMKIRFFTNVSHEFRTPLTLILAPIEKLLKNTKDPDQRKQFEMIDRNARRLLNLVNQLLDFRKLEVEDVKLYLSEGNIVKFIKESVNSFTDLSDKKKITLSFNSGIEELQASFDMDKLGKILFNLLSNAFKFTPDNGRIDVNVNCFDNDSSSEGIKILEIKVKDTGIGIPKEKHEKIFERFFTSEVPNSVLNQGSGIGLAITQEFVKIHGGMITVDSEPEKGSCFTVTLPVKEIASSGTLAKLINESEEELVLDKSEPPVTAKGFDNVPVVLLVEDNEDFRLYLKDSLGEYFSIIEAKNGQEGWQKALACMPDLIISDLMMPELNGIDFCKKIKKDQRTAHIPFVLLTAHKAEEVKLKGLDIGANDFISKPFNFEMLLSRTRNLISQRQLLQKAYGKKISVETSKTNIVSLDDKLIQNAIKVVEDNLSDSDFSVEALSKELGMSRVHLYKKVVALTGTSPIEFIRKIRLQRAIQLLEESQLTIAEVAYQVGFNNRKYFTKYFKEEYKVLPSVYLERKKNEV
ncbi:two-component regulator propeller domain-containing protein [Pontibacter silvestris]|uniref:histidine kinase n=1 Tax=Pontibacter silvestris TaxID=2305183 RepID=A0ABW4WWZ8_9BACT|nr:two-component regulator propeller domain-containing protein [Pontibacter silvestris]MCC9137583.1 response regulator [Pontibacter silvestris]